MRKIQIGFSRPKKVFPIFSWAIRLVEWTSYSHVYVKSFSSIADEFLVYQASGTQVNFMGFCYFSRVAHVVKEFEFEISEEAHKAYLKWAIRMSGAPYGLKAVLGILLVRCFNLKRNPLSDGEKTWFCSELAGRVLSDFMGAHFPPEELEMAGPKKLFELCSRMTVNGAPHD